MTFPAGHIFAVIIPQLSEFCIYAARNLQLCVTLLGSHVQMLCFGTEKDTHVHVLLWIEGGQKTTELSINRMTYDYTTMVTATIDGRKKIIN